MPPRRTWLWFVLIVLANFVLVRLLMPGPEGPVTVPYTLFKEEVGKGNVEAIFSRGETITGRFMAPVTYPPAGEPRAAPGAEPRPTGEQGAARRGPPRTVTTFTTTLPSFVGPGLEALLIEHGVEISAEPIYEGGSPWATLFFAFAPALLFIGFYVWMFRRAAQQGGGLGGGLMGIGRSRARRYDQERETKVTFDDVAGIDEAENELVEIVDFLRDPQKYTRLGGTAPKGVLLVGPPGTGKTLLARAVAGEAGVPFFSMSGAEFVEMIVGVGAARVRDLFKQAREQAPAIIFIDELDAIGRARGQMAIGGSSEQEQTLNQILTEMDGFSGREGIIVLAATNQPDVLDKALLRPGRPAARARPRAARRSARRSPRPRPSPRPDRGRCSGCAPTACRPRARRHDTASRSPQRRLESRARSRGPRTGRSRRHPATPPASGASGQGRRRRPDRPPNRSRRSARRGGGSAAGR